MLAHYDFVSKETLAYFSQRPAQAKRDSDFALDYVKTHAAHARRAGCRDQALEFKCSVLWAQLDALWSAYVDDAFRPEPGCRERSHERAARPHDGSEPRQSSPMMRSPGCRAASV